MNWSRVGDPFDHTRLAALAISNRRPNWQEHIVLYFGIIMLLFSYVDRRFSFY